jgi:oligopeptide/dipeptide ABC transporter ATP-binding protein
LPEPFRTRADASGALTGGVGPAPLLAVRDLRVAFPTERSEARAVDGVSFDVGAGEIVGLVGESGCGKSVTAFSILGLVPPPGRIAAGSSIRLAGEELVTAPEARMRALRGRVVSMVFQEPMSALNPVMTVGRQVVEGLRAHRSLGAREARARGVELLDEVGIAEPRARFDAYPHQLSGGMRQRVLLAMALACEPRLLVADEPTTALDVTVQAQILELLLQLRDRHRMGILLVTHDLGIVAETCERVVVMYAGRVVETGPVEAIFRTPRHPYTRGLLGSLPRVGDRRTRLRPIKGMVPAATAWPTGCRFRERCSRAWERCLKEPPLLGVGLGAESRCWLVEEPERDPPGRRE